MAPKYVNTKNGLSEKHGGYDSNYPFSIKKTDIDIVHFHFYKKGPRPPEDVTPQQQLTTKKAKMRGIAEDSFGLSKEKHNKP